MVVPVLTPKMTNPIGSSSERIGSCSAPTMSWTEDVARANAIVTIAESNPPSSDALDLAHRGSDGAPRAMVETTSSADPARGDETLRAAHADQEH